MRAVTRPEGTQRCECGEITSDLVAMRQHVAPFRYRIRWERRQAKAREAMSRGAKKGLAAKQRDPNTQRFVRVNAALDRQERALAEVTRPKATDDMAIRQ